MRKLILIFIVAFIGGSVIAQSQYAKKPLTNVWESLQADTINSTDVYLLNGVELGLINNVLYVDGEFATAGITATGSVNAPFTTIAAALTASASGDVILVAPGSYTEHLTFTQDSIVLLSMGGAEVTFVEATVASGAGIDVVDYTTISGFTFSGDAGGAIVELNTGETNVRLFNNTFNTTGANTFGISIGAAGSDSLFIQGNKFLTGSGDGAIWLQKTNVETVVDDNYFFGTDSTSGYAIQTAGINIGQFTNNIIEGYASGIFVHTVTSGTAGSYNVIIDGNVIKNSSNGIRLGHASQTVNMDSIKVTNNTLYWNTIGVYIADDATVLANTFDIIGNRFLSNTTNYVNDHSSLVPRSLSNWEDDDFNVGGSTTFGRLISDVMTLNGTITSNQTYATGSTPFYFRTSLSATSGDHNNLRARAQSTAVGASTSDIRGIYGQGIANESLYAGSITGVFANAIAKNASTSVNVRGAFIEAESEATPTAITNLYGAYIRTKVHRDPATDYYGLMIDNEKLSTGFVADAAIALKSTTWGAAETSMTYGIDMNSVTKIGTADIRLHNGATINNSTADLLTITEAAVDIEGGLWVTNEHWEQATITGDTQLSDVSAEYMLVYLVAEETAGNTATLDLGTTAGANDIFINQTFTASTITTISINKVFSFSGATELYLNDDDAGSSWNSGSLNVYLHFVKIAE